ncbi:PQQ-like beta-propeller repeat protein [Candidatus Pelagibacter sp.]|nr:PQQ-like beta-propeller repeat protein [Candidatus Pelagibacter sp.]
MNRFKLFILLIFLTSCSLDTKSGIWTKKQKIIEEEKQNIKSLFETENVLENELNTNLVIKLTSRLSSNSFINSQSNNNGRLDYDGNLKSTSKFKFSKIKNFESLEPEILAINNNLIFHNNKGTLIKFDPSSKIIWKKNFYNKQEKKINPIIFFNNNKNILIVADNISKYYAVDIENGNLIWSKENSSPFNSQVKIYKDKFFIVDFENTLRAYSINDGKELWNIKTGDTFIKSEKKLSIVITNNIVYFNNSIGDISAVDIESGNLLWQTPTQNSTIYQDSFSLKTSDLITDGKSIVFSNNKNEFYSIDAKSGFLKWKQKINSNLTSSMVNQLIFTISNEGYFVVIDDKTGNMIRVTDVFSQFKKRRLKINPVGFFVGKQNIYLTTNHGRLLVIDISSGKTKKVLKIDNEKISRPFVLNKNLFIIKENSIIKLN